MKIPHPIFQIKDSVYHKTPESPRGIIIDICYYYYLDLHKYLVAWDKDSSDWYLDNELSREKEF